MPEPLIGLDPDGSGPRISYNVPDATTFTGRHYIELDFPFSPFPSVTGPTAEDLQPAPTPLPILIPVGTVTPVAAPAIASFRPAEVTDKVIEMARESRRPLVRMSTPDGPRLLMLDSGDEPGSPDKNDGLPASGGINEPVEAVCDITDPQDGAVLAGTGGRLTVTVTGTASAPGSSVRQVQVRVGTGAWRNATSTGAQFSTWRATVTLPGPGTHLVAVRAEPVKGLVGDAGISLTVGAGNGAGGASQAVALRITQPVASSTALVPDASGVAVLQMAGTASHASGIQSVSVQIVGVPDSAVQANLTGGTWHGSVRLPSIGRYDVVATATSVDGHTATAQVRAEVRTQRRVTVSRKLVLVETYRLSNFLGEYGAGRVIKTFSLLPGERTKISIKSYRKVTTSQKSTSSIFDSMDSKSSDEFANDISDEQGSKQAREDTLKYGVSTSGEGSWGVAKVSMKAELSGGFNASREDFGKRVSNATSKHAQATNATRNLTINTESESTAEEGLEETIDRELSNVNVSRTLNFVFRQMNQAYISALHLVDVRLAYVHDYLEDGKDGVQTDQQEVSIAEMAGLLGQVVVPGYRQAVHDRILALLGNIVDYNGELRSIVEEHTPTTGGPAAPVAHPDQRYYRIKRDEKSDVPNPFGDDATDKVATVEGILLSVRPIVLRTDGVYVESILGQGPALDDFSLGLQEQAVREKTLANDRVAAALSIAATGDDAAAKRFALLFPPAPAAAAHPTP